MRISLKPSLYLLKTLALIDESTKDDWNYIMDTIHFEELRSSNSQINKSDHPGELWKYIKDELTGKHD